MDEENNVNLRVETYLEGENAEPIPIWEYQGQIDPGSRFLWGAIEIIIDGEVFLSRHNADSLDMFWDIWVGELTRLRRESKARVVFTEQSTDINMWIEGDQVRLRMSDGSREEVAVQAPVELFVRAMLEQGRRFFELLLNSERFEALKANPVKRAEWKGAWERVGEAEREWGTA